jgi:SAM-dependent methyltransferase
MSLDSLQEHWNALGAQDPLWAILSDPTKRAGRWQLEDFLETGRSWIAEVVRYLDEVCPSAGRDRALDFGCGVGRLTQALAERFRRCDGIDIAPSMIRRAEELNRFGSRCTYHLRRAPDLGLFEDDCFDFVYTILVLQHMPPALAAGYVREFVRVLKPGGALIFQLPADRIAVDFDAAGTTSRLQEKVPPGALEARLQLTPEPAPQWVLEAGDQVPLYVSVTNEGGRAWQARGDGVGRFEIKLANRWLGRDGEVAVAEDGRTLLPHDVWPGSELTLPLLVTTPSDPGSYLLEIAIVQDGCEWRDGHGRMTAVVDVVPAASAGGEPKILMFSLARPRVLELLEESGATLIEMRRDELAGPHFTSFTYCATKQPDRRGDA